MSEFISTIHFLVQNPPLWLWLYIFAFGAILGSFFNCIIYRIPQKESFIFSRSHCPVCGKNIRAVDNIPILSFFILRGRCRQCKAAISWTYPVVEFLTALWFCFLFYWFISNNFSHLNRIYRALFFFYLAFLLPIAWIDVRHRIIPDLFTLPGIVLGFLASLLPGGISPLQSFLGMLAGSAPLYFLGIVGEKLFRKGEAMGFGDIKMMCAVGALMGAKLVLLSLFFGAILGSVGGIIVLLMKRGKGDHRIAFGPYLSLGIVIAVFAGDWTMDIYLGWINRIIVGA